MQYKYVTEQLDYSDLASGRVFYSLSGHPAFPVRLASEIFQRCVASRKTIYNDSTPCVLYDPCCGAAYHLSVLAYLHREQIREVTGSDVDEKAVALAGQNLGLLDVAGLDKRISGISNMIELYNKDSHKDALASAYVLKDRISALAQEYPLITKVFQASATDSKAIIQNVKARSVDIVFTDIPYGQHSQWHGLNSDESSDPLWLMLDALTDILSASSIVAIVSDKQQKVSHKGFQRVEQFQVGKRRVVILKPVQ
jgi:23S rRNA (guanine2535-N1)-methyltransferase